MHFKCQICAHNGCSEQLQTGQFVSLHGLANYNHIDCQNTKKVNISMQSVGGSLVHNSYGADQKSRKHLNAFKWNHFTTETSLVGFVLMHSTTKNSLHTKCS